MDFIWTTSPTIWKNNTQTRIKRNNINKNAISNNWTNVTILIININTYKKLLFNNPNYNGGIRSTVHIINILTICKIYGK